MAVLASSAWVAVCGTSCCAFFAASRARESTMRLPAPSGSTILSQSTTRLMRLSSIRRPDAGCGHVVAGIPLSNSAAAAQVHPVHFRDDRVNLVLERCAGRLRGVTLTLVTLGGGL